MWWIGIIVLAVLAVVAYKAMQKGKEQKELPAGPAKVTPRTLKEGDVVTYMGADYLVEGKVTYSEDGDSWWEYRMTGDEGTVWLSAEYDDGMWELGVYQEVEDLEFEDDPPRTIEYMGESYKLSERGQARVTAQGETGNRSSGSCLYWDYEGPGRASMSVEKWGMNYEVYVGSSAGLDRFDLTRPSD